MERFILRRFPHGWESGLFMCHCIKSGVYTIYSTHRDQMLQNIESGIVMKDGEVYWYVRLRAYFSSHSCSERR
jgi:hypothetical protein